MGICKLIIRELVVKWPIVLQCVCNRDSVRIKMDTFVKRYQPDRYEAWMAGTDVGTHPEDDTRKLYPTRQLAGAATSSDTNIASDR